MESENQRDSIWKPSFPGSMWQPLGGYSPCRNRQLQETTPKLGTLASSRSLEHRNGCHVTWGNGWLQWILKLVKKHRSKNMLFMQLLDVAFEYSYIIGHLCCEIGWDASGILLGMLVSNHVLKQPFPPLREAPTWCFSIVRMICCRKHRNPCWPGATVLLLHWFRISIWLPSRPFKFGNAWNKRNLPEKSESPS